MSQFFLIGDVRVGTRQFYAGDLVDDLLVDTRALEAQGGVLWPASDALIQKAAAQVTKLRHGGAPPEVRQIIMLQAVAAHVLGMLRGTDPAATGGFGD